LRGISLTQTHNTLDMLLTTGTPLPNDIAWDSILALGIGRISARVGEGDIRTLANPTTPLMRIANHDVQLPPAAFLQASDAAQVWLTQPDCSLTGKGHIADLFCGIGTFSLPLAQHSHVHAAESAPDMLAALHQVNHPRITCEQRDLFTHPLTPAELERFDTIILNPPRAGAQTQVQNIPKSPLKHLIMVSCNPATFSRDAAFLLKNGYEMPFAAALDQFTYSAHLEIIAQFKRIN
jgi:23S rRNA (uracil1939-C5)-methyltransferase